MKKMCLPFIAFAMMTVGCENKSASLGSGIDLANLDRSAAPGADFYQYACGGWMKSHPLTDEYSRFGSFDLLAENNRVQIKELIEEMASRQNSEGVARKIGDLYNVAMDSVKLNADGAKPIQRQLSRIQEITDRNQLPSLIAGMRRAGYDPFFVVYVGADAKNSDMNIVNTYQSGLGLGEREYYLDEDEHTVTIRNAYREHVEKMFGLAGFSDGDALKAAQQVLDIETKLAASAKSAVELRDPQANYNKMSVAELKKLVPGMDWDSYLKAIGLPQLDEINIGQPESVKTAVDLISTADIQALKSYLQWKVIDAAASYLSDDFVAQNFDFYGRTLSGRKEMQSRWKRSVATVDGALGEAVGQVYVEKYFPAAAKERMLTLVENLKKALAERISKLTWMSDETKNKALEKLLTIYVKIGYPDKWRDYSSLEIKNDSYWENILRSNDFDFEYMLSKAGKPVDKEQWLMTPQTVNAYYNPTTNEICFPAGILQYPFFDMQADDAFNYGAIGVVIGHEMTHGFDDQGRQFDKDGNLRDWWSEKDAENFESRAQVLVDYYDAIEVLPGLQANGKFTLGENIADYGGIQIAYTALQNILSVQPLEDIDGYTPSQRFFLAYANLWAGNIRDEQIRVLTKSDPHSLGRWRVNGILPHITAWYEAFGVKEGDPLFLPAAERAEIW